MGDDHRIAVLEHEMQQTRETSQRMEHKIDSIADTLRSLVRIEERQVAANVRMAATEQAVQEQGRLIKGLQIEMPENLDKRLVSIETKMPGLVESRRWVVTGVLAGVGMIGIALVHLILK